MKVAPGAVDLAQLPAVQFGVVATQVAFFRQLEVRYGSLRLPQFLVNPSQVHIDDGDFQGSAAEAIVGNGLFHLRPGLLGLCQGLPELSIFQKNLGQIRPQKAPVEVADAGYGQPFFTSGDGVFSLPGRHISQRKVAEQSGPAVVARRSGNGLQPLPERYDGRIVIAQPGIQVAQRQKHISGNIGWSSHAFLPENGGRLFIILPRKFEIPDVMVVDEAQQYKRPAPGIPLAALPGIPPGLFLYTFPEQGDGVGRVARLGQHRSAYQLIRIDPGLQAVLLPVQIRTSVQIVSDAVRLIGAAVGFGLFEKNIRRGCRRMLSQ